MKSDLADNEQDRKIMDKCKKRAEEGRTAGTSGTRGSQNGKRPATEAKRVGFAATTHELWEKAETQMDRR